MIRYFTPGPRVIWKGVCAVGEDGRYTHYPCWPDRTKVMARNQSFIFDYTLTALIEGHEWIEVVLDPDLQVDEGL